MPALDFEAEYNNRQRVPDHPAIMTRWAAASSTLRDRLSPYEEHAYGSRPRNRFDLYSAARRGHSTPLVVYIHGGYWQRGDRKDYSFAVGQLVAAGADVVMPSYTLCPEVSIADIVAEMRLLLVDLWRRYGRHPVVVGHSAGGHLAAAMLATDWSKIDGVPDDLVRAAYSISGVFDLEPLVGTSLNEALRLTPDMARAVSPLFGSAPARGRTLVAAVGGDESGEFIRQSLAIAAAWSAAGTRAECVVIPGTNHFTVVDELTRPDSAMVARIVSLAR